MKTTSTILIQWCQPNKLHMVRNQHLGAETCPCPASEKRWIQTALQRHSWGCGEVQLYHICWSTCHSSKSQ